MNHTEKHNDACRKIDQLKALVRQYERQLLDTDDHDEARIYIRHAVAARAKLAEAEEERKHHFAEAEAELLTEPDEVQVPKRHPIFGGRVPKKEALRFTRKVRDPMVDPDMDFHVPEDILLEVDTPDIDTRQELLVSPALYAELEGTAWAEDYHLVVDMEAPDFGWHNLNHVLPISGVLIQRSTQVTA